MISTGLKGLDNILTGLRLGDNVVWQIDDIIEYKDFVEPFVEEAIRENKIGFLYYALETGGENQTFITQINVEAPSSQTGEQASNTVPIMVIIVIVCIFLVIGYMISTHVKHRRR